MKNLFNWLKEWPKRRNYDLSELLYQVREYNGELWLTYNGMLICPCSMFNKTPIEALKEMREYYIKRNGKE